MPLRINLLAEQHALEEMRRRDPVKRAMWIGVLLAAMVLIYSSSLFAKSMLGKSELTRLETDLSLRTNDYRQILDNKHQLEVCNLRLQALNKLATNRFLVGNLLNALQQTAMSDVSLLHVRLDQSFVLTDEVKEVKEDNIKGKPATSTEKIMVTIDARDNSPKSNASTPYQVALTAFPYFTNSFGKKVQISLKQIGLRLANGEGKGSQNFTLELNFPDQTR